MRVRRLFGRQCSQLLNLALMLLIVRLFVVLCHSLLAPVLCAPLVEVEVRCWMN